MNIDSDDLVASHARLPRGTQVRVINDDTGAEAIVEITGRIPPSGSRIIDLSFGAALQLGLDPDLSAQVTISVVDDEEAAAPAVAAAPEPVEEAPYVFDDGTVLSYDGSLYGGDPIISYDDSDAPPPAPVVAEAPPPPPEPAPAPPSVSTPAPAAATSPPAPVPAPVYTPPAYPVYTPPPRAPQYTPAAPQYTPPAAPPPVNPYYYSQTPPQQDSIQSRQGPSAKIIPRMPDLGSFKVYRVQVGAFRAARNAKDVFDRLVSAGFSPAFESYGDLFRVVLSGVRAGDIPAVAQRLGNAGFTEAWIREEM
jgi:hypothetical protein